MVRKIACWHPPVCPQFAHQVLVGYFQKVPTEVPNMDPLSTGWVLFKSTHCWTHWTNYKWNPWVLSQITSKSTQWVLCERTPRFLSQFTSQCAHQRTWATHQEFFESSFKKYPVMWSQCTQSHTQWVLWGFVVKLSHIVSSLWVLWKKPTRYIVITCLGTFWKNSQRTLDEWLRSFDGHIVMWIVKETKGFFHKVPTRYFLMWFEKELKGFACNLSTGFSSGYF